MKPNSAFRDCMTYLHTTIQAQKDLARAQMQGWAHAHAWWQQEMQVLREIYEYPPPQQGGEPSVWSTFRTISDPHDAHLSTRAAAQKAIERAKYEVDYRLVADLLERALAILRERGSAEQLNSSSTGIGSLD